MIGTHFFGFDWQKLSPTCGARYELGRPRGAGMASERTLGACLPLPATGRPDNRFAGGKIDVYGKAPLADRATCA